MDGLTLFGTWIAALLTLCILSFLYKDNPFYKFAEYLFVGISAGFWVAYQYHNLLLPNLIEPLFGTADTRGAFAVVFLDGQWDIRILTVLAGLLGLTMLFRFFSKVAWVSRYGIAFSVGLGAGLMFIVYLQTNCLAQIKGTIIPPVVLDEAGNFQLGPSISNTLLIIGVVSGLVYFYFSKEHKGALGGVARLGIWFLMVSFGAAFGYTVMARISLLIGRMDFLIEDWIKGTLVALGLL
ncbi:MAG: hypothetical protein PVH29_04465 [Candidatus Zixiibacteriota bacterium]|jgi:hypothetical protein